MDLSSVDNAFDESFQSPKRVPCFKAHASLSSVPKQSVYQNVQLVFFFPIFIAQKNKLKM